MCWDRSRGRKAPEITSSCRHSSARDAGNKFRVLSIKPLTSPRFFFFDPHGAMVHYIRFLKTPLLSKPNPKECRISALITITTDLGDALFTKDTSITVYIHPIASTAAHGKGLQTVRWTSKSRVLAITINFIRSQLQLPARLFVTSTDGGLDDVVTLSSLPGIVPAWSAPFNDVDMKQADLLVERRLKFPDRGSLSIWEETGDSIARHIWYDM
jgi:hypothetical protein